MSFPPKWIHRVFERIIDPYLFDSIYGDLLQDYNDQVRKHSRVKAQWYFVMNLIGYIRYSGLLKIVRPKQTHNSMDIWKNYFKSSIRNLVRNKRNTSISLIGLIVGFIASISILQYCLYESSYDDFHTNENLYRTTHTFTNSSATTENASTFFAAKDAFLEQIPEIENATHYFQTNIGIKKGTDVFPDINGIATDPAFFELFSYEIINGNPNDLNKPDVVLLSRSAADRYFGNDRIINERVEIQNVFGQTWEATVAAVYTDFPDNSHLSPEVIIPVQKLIDIAEEGTIFGNISFSEVRWRWLSFPTYIQLKDEADQQKVIRQANEIIAENREVVNAQLNQKHSIWLQPVQDIHITPGIAGEPRPTNDKEIINMFLLIAMAILAIAWINYINISTARSVTRSKEVGIRKVLGSHRSQLRNQFLLESFILNFIALSVTVILLAPISPVLEDVVAVNFFSTMLDKPVLPIAFLFMILFGSVLSGLYPAFQLSNYKVLEVLKGQLQFSSQGKQLRRVLVVVQFVFSITLIAALLIVQSQMSFMIDHKLGMNIDQTVLLNAPTNEFGVDNYTSNMRSLGNELKAVTGVDQVSISSIAPGIINGWRNSSESRNGEEAGIFVHRSIVDEHFFDLYSIPLLAGRHLSESHGNEQNSFILNQTAVENLGLGTPEEALNKKVYFAGEEFVVVGVVDDFYQRGVQIAYEPMTFQLDTGLFGNYISIRLGSENLSATLASIESAYKNIFPNSPYEARILDDVFKAQYDNEARFRNLFTIFSLVALVISCLGLVGLATHLVNQKLKEISIRKVLGARISNLFLLLNREYAVIAVLAFVISVPLIAFLAPIWLENYANHIDLHMGFYIVPLVIIGTIVLATTIAYTLRVVFVNPARILQEE